MNLLRLTALEALALMRSKELSAVELCDAYLDQIAARDPVISAYLRVTDARAREEAARSDAGGDVLPLNGLPTAIKDVLCTSGVKTTCASRMLEDYVPPYTATAVRRLYDAGIVMLGKTNMDEFAMGSSTENSAFGPTRNPWNTDCVPGGSSGGSAAAVAAGEAIWALGSDTGGSIRQPAAFCGVVGLKPTYGSVSRYGLVAFASSFDQVGPITKDVRDAALMMQFLVGKDPCDSTSVDYPYEISLPDDRDMKGVRIGVVKQLSGAGNDPDVKAVFDAALRAMEEAGAEIAEASLPHSEYALPAYYILASAEASANLARFDGVRYGFRAQDAGDVTQMYEKTRSAGFGDEVKRRIMLGTYALSSGYYEAYYGQAQKVRTLIREDFDRELTRFDLLVSPTAPTPAFKVGEKTDDPLSMYLSDICTIPVNLAGLPAVSIPCGLSGDGLPIGLQLIGPPFSANKLLQAARGAEIAIGFDEAPAMVGSK
jgi:aspartyl-tRNA(Asn)/glutamyl-tRNA(Gln) amidotransferase subunit A